MLNNLKIFVMVIKTGSFTRTAEILGLSPSAVSKKIDKLEQHCQRVLAIRNRYLVKPTPEGKILFDTYQNLGSEFNQVVKSIQKTKPIAHKAELKISLHTGLAFSLIAPYLGDFYTNYPEIKVNLVYQREKPEMTKDQFNLAISLFEIHEPGYRSKFIREELLKLYCNPNYVKSHGLPSSIDQLDNHAMMGYFELDTNRVIDQVCFRNAFTHHEYVLDCSAPVLRSNMPTHQRKMSFNIDCIFGCWQFLCEQDVLTGRLIPVLPEYEALPTKFFLTVKRRPSPEELVFIDFLHHCVNRSIPAKRLIEF